MPFFDSHLATPDAVRIMGKHKPFTVFLRRMYIMAIAVILLALPTCALAATPDEYNGPTTYDWITVQHYVAGETSSSTDGWFLVTIPDRMSFEGGSSLECTLHYAMLVPTVGSACLWAYVGSQNELYLIDPFPNNKIAYDIYMPNNAYVQYASKQTSYYMRNGRYLIEVYAGPRGEYKEGEDTIYFTLDESSVTNAEPGKYTDTLSFYFSFGGLPEPPPK